MAVFYFIMITGNEPMQPIVVPGFVYGDGSHEEPSVKGGLTIRQHFAAKAMQGLLVNDGWSERINKEAGNNLVIGIAKASVACADALINELNKTK